MNWILKWMLEIETLTHYE